MEVISPRRARRLPRGLPRKRLHPGAASRPGDPAGPWHLSSWSSSKHGRGETVRGTEHHHFQPCPQQPSWATSGWRSLEAPHPSAAEAGAARGTGQEEAWPGAARAHVEAKRRARGATQSWTHRPPRLCPTAHFGQRKVAPPASHRAEASRAAAAPRASTNPILRCLLRL